MNVTNAEVNFTISSGVRFSSLFPPIVPRIPDMDFISVKGSVFYALLRC
jgi:hypothetical protein